MPVTQRESQPEGPPEWGCHAQLGPPSTPAAAPRTSGRQPGLQRVAGVVAGRSERAGRRRPAAHGYQPYRDLQLLAREQQRRRHAADGPVHHSMSTVQQHASSVELPQLAKLCQRCPPRTSASCSRSQPACLGLQGVEPELEGILQAWISKLQVPLQPGHRDGSQKRLSSTQSVSAPPLPSSGLGAPKAASPAITPARQPGCHACACNGGSPCLSHPYQWLFHLLAQRLHLKAELRVSAAAAAAAAVVRARHRLALLGLARCSRRCLTLKPCPFSSLAAALATASVGIGCCTSLWRR